MEDNLDVARTSGDLLRDNSELFRPVLSRLSDLPGESSADGKNMLITPTNMNEKDRLNPYARETTRLTRADMLRKTEGRCTIFLSIFIIFLNLIDLCIQFSSKSSKKQKLRTMSMSRSEEEEVGAARLPSPGATGFRIWVAGLRPFGNLMTTRCKNYAARTTPSTSYSFECQAFYSSAPLASMFAS